MTDVTQENALKAMRKAYEMGDMESARRMAALAKSLENQPSQQGFLGQVNRGIADTVDAISLRGPRNAMIEGVNRVFGTELASPDTISETFRNLGIRTAEGEPETVGQALGRGVGEAAASAPAVIGGLGLVGRGSGAVAGAAREASAALRTLPGFAAEITAGAASRGAQEAVENAGGSDLAQGVASVAAPLGVAGATMATRGAVRGAGRAAGAIPGVGMATRAARGAARAVLPMTDAGAREVAREELVRRAGSEARLEELGARISESDPLVRTPAQQTEDPNLLALEDAAKAEDPLLRVELDRRADVTREAAAEGVQEGTRPAADAQRFFRERVRNFEQAMQQRVEAALQGSTERLEGVGPNQSEAGASASVVERLELARDILRQEENTLWRAIPETELISTQNATQAANKMIDSTAWAQRRDIPQDITEAFGPNGRLGEQTSVKELYGLYSALRQMVRAEKAADAPNGNVIRIGNNIAEAILRDIDGAPDASEALTQARDFSRAFHETFDQGAVGRILSKQKAGEYAIEPEEALARTVGRSGSGGDVAARRIEGAAPGSGEDIQDFLRGRFIDRALNAEGKFTPSTARRWMRENRELMGRYPELRNEFSRALANRDAADSFAVRARARMEALENQSPIADFASRTPETAVDAILKASDPLAAAKSAVRTARKDGSGKAVAGLKGAFSDRLISQATGSDGVLSGKGLQALLRDRKMMAAMRQVYSDQEFRRLQTIAEQLAALEAPRGETGPVINAPVNQLLARVVQVAAAQTGGKVGSGAGIGGSLQTANIFTRTANTMMDNLTNARARELLRDAVEDPGLMKALMVRTAGQKVPRWAASRLAPYLTGAAVTGEE